MRRAVLRTFLFVAVLGLGCMGVEASSIDVVYPTGAPQIASGFQSLVGVNGKHRGAPHQGIDIKGKKGQSILAAADGKVLEATVEHCWGPTIAVDHGKGLDGRKIIALYGHVGEMLVDDGDQIKRGQVIARLGNNQDTYQCIYGVRHLHFQIGREYRDHYSKGDYWGWAYFLEDGDRGVNPHLYWASGRGKVTCFEPNRTYKPGSLTYPVPCQAYAGSDSKECKAACEFVEKATGESCEDVGEALEEIYGKCGENEKCRVNALVKAAEGDWSKDDASGFLEKLTSYGCEF